ncbi:hypothetical protein C0U41_29440, partial [Klebsiella pneumoniae]
QGAGNIGKIARHLAEIKLIPQKTEEERPWLIKSRCFSVEPPLNVKCRRAPVTSVKSPATWLKSN